MRICNQWDISCWFGLVDRTKKLQNISSLILYPTCYCDITNTYKFIQTDSVCVSVTFLPRKQQRKKQRLLVVSFHIFLGLKLSSFCLWLGILLGLSLDRPAGGHTTTLCYRRQAVCMVFITAGALPSQLKHSQAYLLFGSFALK